jgi:putative aminopeptidase FrvX
MNRKDIKTLKDYCLAPVKEILGNEMYLFIDNNSSVLGVAHADVHFPQKQWYFSYNNTLNLAFSPNLDDRLGVFLLLEYLPRFAKIDTLITDNEEIELSTGKFFYPEKEYNWIVEFDRNGDGSESSNARQGIKTVSPS